MRTSNDRNGVSKLRRHGATASERKLMRLIELLCVIGIIATLAAFSASAVVKAGRKLVWQAQWCGIYHNSEIAAAIDERDFYDPDRTQFKAILKW